MEESDPHDLLDAGDPHDLLDPHVTNVLSRVVQNADAGSCTYHLPHSNDVLTGGFPAVMKRKSVKISQPGMSIFKQNQLKKFRLQPAVAPPVAVEACSRSNSEPVVGGLEQMKHEVEEENRKRLSNMTDEEIENEKAELVRHVDYELLLFLQNRVQRKFEGSANTETSATPREPGESRKSPELGELGKSPEFGKLGELGKSRILGESRKAGKSMKNIKRKEQANAKFVNMNIDEPEKKEWMNDMPNPEQISSNWEGLPARFGFDGLLIPQGSEVPVHLGLHHHGEEPHRAGYTVAELFLLARSANTQQRVLALQVLANILQNSRRGQQRSLLSPSVVGPAIRGGLVSLLRWNIDDSTEASVAAGIHCLASLLYCQDAEKLADKCARWYLGNWVTDLEVDLPPPEEDEENQVPQTDADLVLTDVVRGLLKMSVLQRLSYILRTWSAKRIELAIDGCKILIALARHSSGTAYEIVKHPTLLDSLISLHLPLPGAKSPPLPLVMKLLRVIASAGRSMATIVMEKVVDSLSCYIAAGPEELGLPPGECILLQTESLQLWSVVLRYGTKTALVADLYDVLSRLLCQSLRRDSPASASPASASLFNVLESALLAVRFGQSRPLMVQPLGLSHLADWMWLLAASVAPRLGSLGRSYVAADAAGNTDLDGDAALLNVVASYFQHATCVPHHGPLELLDAAAAVGKALDEFILSRGFTTMVTALRGVSVLSGAATTYNSSVDALPSYECIAPRPEAQPPPCAHEAASAGQSSCIGFVSAVGRLVFCASQRLKHLLPLRASFAFHKEVVAYVRAIGKNLKNESVLLRQHECLLFHFLILCVDSDYSSGSSDSVHPLGADDLLSYFRAALVVLPNLSSSQSFILHSIFSRILFNSKVVAHFPGDIPLNSMNLVRDGLSSAGLAASQAVPVSQLLKRITDNLSATCRLYCRFVAPSDDQIEDCSVLSRLRTTRTTAVPVDWHWLPLVSLCSLTMDKTNANGKKLLDESDIERCLEWLHFLERELLLSHLSVVDRYVRLLPVFLHSDAFLSQSCHAHLEQILKFLFSSRSQLDRLDLTSKIAGLSSFYDLFDQVLDQFQAASYGDELFSAFLLPPLMTNQDLQMRRLFWGEKVVGVRFFRLPIAQVPFDLSVFLEPPESDAELLKFYAAALFKHVAPSLCPLPFLIAIHHVNRFIFATSLSEPVLVKLQSVIWQSVSGWQNKESQSMLVNYKQADISSKLGMSFYESLPNSRQATMQKFHTVLNSIP